MSAVRILADVNVPEEQVSALRGDGHTVAYSRDVEGLEPEATDDAIVEYARTNGFAVLSTDQKDFGDRTADVPILAATQAMSGGDVRAAVARLEALPLDPAATDPIWLSSV